MIWKWTGVINFHCLMVVDTLCSLLSTKLTQENIITWSFSYFFFVQFHGKKIGATISLCYIQVCFITRCVIKGTMYCTMLVSGTLGDD